MGRARGGDPLRASVFQNQGMSKNLRRWGFMRQYIVDAFTDELFKGNTAAVCILDRWIDDLLMQNIAKENNFSERHLP